MLTETKTVEICEEFARFAEPVRERFAAMSQGELFETAGSDDLFDHYLGAFPAGTNPVFRERTTHDCQCCKHFVRRVGGLVAIKDGEVQTVWEGLDLPEPYRTVARAMDATVRSRAVKSVFRTKEREYGQAYNYDPKTNERYDHFHAKIADRHRTDDPGAKRGECDATFQVLKRGLTEIRVTDLMTVLDLIDSNGLYRGQEHREAVGGFVQLIRDFERHGSLSARDGDLFAWENLNHRNARFRNTVIGTLLTDLAEGKELDDAVKAFEVKVAPANYKRPTAVVTQKMVDDALATLNKLDLGGAIVRRHARLSDVSVNDVLFVDNSAKGKMKDGVAALLADVVKKSTPDLRHAVKIGADEFVRDVLPGVKRLEVFVENRHQGNFVSLTGADGPERLFKWDNNFAWSYDGDVTDSVKQRVKAAGGKIDCKLRVSLSWFNTDDLDLHALTPDGQHVYFREKCGILDVDMNAHSNLTRNAVENLAFNRLADGVYSVWVNQFNRRESVDVGFAIEVEFAGSIQQFSYPKRLANNQNVQCFKLHVKGGQLVKVESELTGGNASQEKWGVKTETLVPAQLVCHSPNFWGENAVGAKHLIFALQGCKNPGSIRTLFNEYLRGDLVEKHKKVFEILGSKTKAAFSDEQVSGVGFTSARGDSVTVVVDGKRAFTLGF